MGLSGSQSEILREIVMSQFGGTSDNSDEFSQFVREKLDVNIFDTWTSAKKVFSLQVTDVLGRLQDRKLVKFLESLEERVLPDGEANEANAQLKAILQQLRSSESSNKTQGSIILPRKILIAAGIIEKPIGDYIKNEMQEVMGDFEILCTWDRRTLKKFNLPNDVDQVWGVAAVLRKPPRKDVSDPPLGAVEAALQRLNENRRVVLFTLDSRAHTWTEERIKSLDLNEFIETEQFFDEDDERISFFSTARFKQAWISLRIREIAEKLKDDYEVAISTQSLTETRTVVENSSVRRRYASVIVLGEPHGASAGNAAASNKDLTDALRSRGIEFDYWPDGWANGNLKSSYVLARDPIFVRALSDEEADTRKAVDHLEAALRIAFDTREQITRDLLSACRRIFWRSDGPVWSPLNDVSDPSESSDDLDNIEAQVAPPHVFVEWLRHFLTPDAVIFHEPWDENRPPALIRQLRSSVEQSLGVSGKQPIIRMRPLKELPNFETDKLTIIAIDDLPLPPSVDFRQKALERFGQFDRRIQQIVDQRRTISANPLILRIAMLIEGAKLLQPSDLLEAWFPLRIVSAKQNGESQLSVEPTDLREIDRATARLTSASRP